jgi:autotransporter-associated beta strand protein
MKNRILSTARLPFPLATALAALLASSHASAATLYFDGASNTTWNSAINWSTASGAANPNPGAAPGAADDAFFHITSVTATTAVTMNLAGNQAANSLTFRNTGALNIGPNSSTNTGNKSLTIGSGGITKNLGSAAVNIGRSGTANSVSAVIGANQTWTNNSTTGALTVGTTLNSASAPSATLGLNGKQLTLDGSGNFQFGTATSPNQVLIGNSASSLVKQGAGTLSIGGVNTAFAAPITINAGTLLLFAPGSKGSSTVTIASGATGGVSVAAADAQHVSGGEFILSDNSSLRINYSSTPSEVTAPLLVDTFTLNTGITLQVMGSVAPDVTYPLVTWTNGPADTAAVNAAFNPVIVNGLVGTLNVSDTTLTVTFTTPPVVSWNTGDGPWDTGTANWVKDENPSTFSNARDAVLFGDAAGAGENPIVTLGITASPASVTMSSIARNYTIIGEGSIAGPIDLTLVSGNTGTLTLATANTYTGDTKVEGGVLRLGDGGTGGSLATSSPIITGFNTTFALNQSDTVTQGTDFGLISGDGGFAQTGAGTATLNSLNTFKGPISVTNGTLQIGATGRLGGGTYAGDISIATGSIVEYGGTATQTLSGIISGLGSLVKASGSGILTLSAANTYEGSTTIDGGTLRLADIDAISSTSAISMADGAILQPTIDGVTIDFPITLGGAGTTAQINGPFTKSAGGTVETLTLNQPISGDGNLRLFGSSELFNTNGTIVLNAQNSYTGSTELDTAGESVHLAGVNLFVKLGIANALPTTTILTLDGDVGRGSGRTLSFDLNGFNQTLGGLASVTTRTARFQRVTNTSETLATLTLNSSSESQYGGGGPESTFNGSPVNPNAKIVGNLALTKTGTAKFTLLGAHDYTGNTTVNQGILSQEAPNTLNETSTVTIAASGATLDLNFVGTDTVDKLFIGSTQQPAGVYGALESGAEFESARITGSGTLTVTTGPVAPADPYLTWAGPSVLFDEDANNDGVKNGLAWLLGASGPNANATGLLPIITEIGGSLKLTFDMLPSAARGGAQLFVEHSSNLGISDPWTGAVVPDATGGAASVTFIVTDGDLANPNNPLAVEATISSSEAAAGKLFGRVRANR